MARCWKVSRKGAVRTVCFAKSRGKLQKKLILRAFEEGVDSKENFALFVPKGSKVTENGNNLEATTRRNGMELFMVNSDEMRVTLPSGKVVNVRAEYVDDDTVPPVLRSTHA